MTLWEKDQEGMLIVSRLSLAEILNKCQFWVLCLFAYLMLLSFHSFHYVSMCINNKKKKEKLLAQILSSNLLWYFSLAFSKLNIKNEKIIFKRHKSPIFSLFGVILTTYIYSISKKRQITRKPWVLTRLVEILNYWKLSKIVT